MSLELRFCEDVDDMSGSGRGILGMGCTSFMTTGWAISLVLPNTCEHKDSDGGVEW